MVQRYEARKDYFGNVILPPKNDEGELVLYSDYAALEQRFDALSSKFAALVEEKAALKRERDELKEENETLRCHAYDAELAFERNAELKAENATLKKALDGLKQQLTAIGKVANFVLYKGEEAQKLAMEIENIIDPLYCPKCGACGEEGCCSPDRCIELPCLYGEHYLKSYKELEAENAMLKARLEPIETAAIALVQRLELDKDVKKNNWWLNERAKIMEVIDDNEGCDEN